MAQLSILDLIERKVSVQLNISEDVIAKVIRHKWKSSNEASYLYSTVEDSGLGKWSTRDKKIIRRIEKLNETIEGCTRRLENPDLTEKQRERYENIIRDFSIEKEYLESKI